MTVVVDTMKAKERRQHRIDHGMCPLCGKEAAPYYLCHEHRTLNALTRILNKAVDQKILTKERHGRSFGYGIDQSSGKTAKDIVTGRCWLDLSPGDKRLKPRLGRRPIDLDETLMGIFMDAGKPLTMEEIYGAWGKLRSQRRHATLATDMAAIIKADRRRAERNAKRAAVTQRMAAHA